ncbi:hypothetical protein Tco_1145976 [Tanacetum coccineum]
MASTKAIKYAPQCGDLTDESVVFQSNNFVGNFSYPQSAIAYKEICKFLTNCPLAGAFTKMPSVLYQNLLREFLCTAEVEDPNPPEDDSKVRPLKEFIIKFTVMNGKKPLTLDYKTFCESTRLNYNKGNYVAHLSPKGFHSPLDKGTRTSQPLPEGKSTDAKDLEGNRQLADIGLPATHPDEGISKTKPLPEGTNIDPTDSERLKPLADKDSSTPLVTALSRTDAKYQMEETHSSRFEVSVPNQHQGKTSFEVELDTETLLLTTAADIQALLEDSEGELKDDSKDDVFKAGEEMDEDIQEPDT